MRTVTEWIDQETHAVALGESSFSYDGASSRWDVVRANTKNIVAAYFRHWGIEDTDVLSIMVRRVLERAEIKTAALKTEGAIAQFPSAAIEACDSYMESWITHLEKQIDCHGGTSRCAEVAMRLPRLFRIHPEMILDFDNANTSALQILALALPAQPPNNPTKFAAQPLVNDTSLVRALSHRLTETLVRQSRRLFALRSSANA